MHSLTLVNKVPNIAYTVLWPLGWHDRPTFIHYNNDLKKVCRIFNGLRLARDKECLVSFLVAMWVLIPNRLIVECQKYNLFCIFICRFYSCNRGRPFLSKFVVKSPFLLYHMNYISPSVASISTSLRAKKILKQKWNHFSFPILSILKTFVIFLLPTPGI